MEDLFKAFLTVAFVECIIVNWCIMSISLELKNIRKEFEKKTKVKIGL